MHARIADHVRLPIAETTDYDRHYAEVLSSATEVAERWLRATPGLDFINSVSSWGVTPKVPILLDLVLDQVEKRGVALGRDIHKGACGSMRSAGVLRAFESFMLSPVFRRGIVSHDTGTRLDLYLLERGDGPGVAIERYRARVLEDRAPLSGVLGERGLPIEEADLAALGEPATLYAVLDGWWMNAVDARPALAVRAGPVAIALDDC